MNILGLNCFKHDSSASLLQDGKLIASAEEERFTRQKHTNKFPSEAIKYCLSQANIKPEDLDCVGFYMKPFLKFVMNSIHSIRYLPKTTLFFQGQAYDSMRMLSLKTYLKREVNFNNFPKKNSVLFIEHHLAHAASTFFISSFDEAAILSIDGAGEHATALLAYGSDITIKKIHQVNFPHSLGFVYSAITGYLGFEPNEDEYKVMGFASYGKPVYLNEFRKIIVIDKKGGFCVDLSYFEYHLDLQGALVSKKFIDIFGPRIVKSEAADERAANIAASLQTRLEEVVLSMARYLYNMTKTPNLCLAGGVALNCSMNGRLLRESPFKNIFVQPAANDSGTSLGAARYIYHSLLKMPRRYVMDSAFLGPEYTNSQIERILTESKLRFRHYPNIEEVVARFLSEGRIAGWFQGRMEFGPRALGARSILADPRRAEMKDIVNERIKHREPFRPFAPSVLEEKASDYFEGCTRSPFMTFVYPVKIDKRNFVPAVTHVDGTARVQTVDKQTNHKFYKLIKEFEKITGVPVLLNTSFNVKGEPIVCTPEDAVKCFYSTGLDYLAIGDYLVEK